MAMRPPKIIERVINRQDVREYIAQNHRSKSYGKRRWWVGDDEYFGRRFMLVSANQAFHGTTVVLFSGWELLVVEGSQFSERAKPVTIVKHGVVKTSQKNIKGVISAVHRLRENGCVPPNCELCAKSDNAGLVAHHWNGYDAAADVWWICHSCNVMLPGTQAHSGLVSKQEIINLISTGVLNSDLNFGGKRRLHIRVMPTIALA